MPERRLSFVIPARNEEALIGEVLDLSVEEALDFFGSGPGRIPAAHGILSRLVDVGLGYLALVQPLTLRTLSRLAGARSSVRSRRPRSTSASR